MKRHIPPAIAALVLLVHAGLMYRAALHHTHGVVSYPVDDAFIHLALAKHLAFDGTYGINIGEFAAASSSVGWPYLLSASMKVFGPQVWLPLALNFVIGFFLPFVVDGAARKLGVLSVWARLLIGIAVVELTPFPTVLILGMEHTPHTVATIALIAAGAVWLADDRASAKIDRAVVRLAVLAFLASLWRYEGAFPTGFIAVLALLRRRTIPAGFVLGAGALPGVAFGLYAKAKGSTFLPVPVVLKGRHIEWAKLGDVLGVDLMDRLGVEVALLAIVIGSVIVLALLVRTRGFWSGVPLALALSIGVVLAHLNFASLGWFFRYESYLLATALAFGGIGLAALVEDAGGLRTLARTDRFALGMGVLGTALVLMPLRVRCIRANNETPIACRNIYEQQFQMGRFLALFEAPVAVNDLGAVAWLGKEPVIDLVGLANLPVARAKHWKLDDMLTRDDVLGFTRATRAAIVYDDWFKDAVPARWLRVGRWRIEDGKSPAYPIVSIYATDPEAIPEVIAKLRAFELPEGVTPSGRYRRDLAGDRARPGDRIAVRSEAADLRGVYAVDADAFIGITKIGGVRADGTSAEIHDRIAKALGAPTTFTVERIPSRVPTVHVVGNVMESTESHELSLEAAVAETGTSLAGHEVFVWREQADGTFTKVGGEQLVDGDIVVVR